MLMDSVVILSKATLHWFERCTQLQLQLQFILQFKNCKMFNNVEINHRIVKAIFCY